MLQQNVTAYTKFWPFSLQKVGEFAISKLSEVDVASLQSAKANAELKTHRESEESRSDTWNQL